MYLMCKLLIRHFQAVARRASVLQLFSNLLRVRVSGPDTPDTKCPPEFHNSKWCWVPDPSSFGQREKERDRNRKESERECEKWKRKSVA